MLRALFVLSGLTLIVACSSQPQQAQKSLSIKAATPPNDITLSHVRAYLLIGNIEKAEERFHIIDQPEKNPDALLVLAELRASKGDGLGAQQAFLQSINHSGFNRQQVSTVLLDYFCREKKWSALQGYALGLEMSNMQASIKNQQLSSIALCLFSSRRWPDAFNLLNKLDFNQAIDPFVYLALARLNIEQKQDKVAQQFIEKFSADKTQVSAEMLWTSFEVYKALQQQQLAEQSAQQLTTLFPDNAFTHKYNILTKRSNSHLLEEDANPSNSSPNEAIKPTAIIHRIKKGETLYQLSKHYNISVDELLILNPNLIIDNISLGTPIQVSNN